MAGTSLLALIDDVASILDDVAILAKVAAKKTSGVLGDDLALNAQQVAGVQADRELPVVWAVAKGSLRNKAILVPAALAISSLAPWLVTPLLMVGGAFLCYEGFEKVAHRFFHAPTDQAETHQARAQANADPSIDLVAFEKEKIQGAVRTDFVLSAEIVAISLGIVASKPFLTRLLVLSAIGILMTIGVYGVVALIVKLDDIGWFLCQREGRGPVARWTGRAILASASRLMKLLAVAGTVAMFLVGGGILGHGLPWIHGLASTIEHAVSGVPGIGHLLARLAPALLDLLTGMVAGAVALALVGAGTRIYRRFRTGGPQR